MNLRRSGPRPIFRTVPGGPAPWAAVVLLGLAGLFGTLFLSGCGESTDQAGKDGGSQITYVQDQQLSDILKLMDDQGKLPSSEAIREKFLGLSVPNAEWDREPYVLALATRSRVPTILLLDAPWVQRYGRAGWLENLKSRHSDIQDILDQMPPSILKAFSLPQNKEPQSRSAGDRQGTPPSGEVMAVPYFIKGNVLFYRKDLLKKYCGTETPPETWEELTTQVRKVLAGQAADQSPHPVRYGLLFHLANIHNDFYPMLWGFGGDVFGQGQVLLDNFRPQAIQAADFFRGLVWPAPGDPRMGPAPEEFERFRQPESLRLSFLHGEALFMINWNTRLGDLRQLIQKAEASDGPQPGWIRSVDDQVGWAPVPRGGAHPSRYVNIGSFGWGLNREAVQGHAQRTSAMNFLRLVASFDLQYLAAVRFGQIPSRIDVISKLKEEGQAQDAVQMFEKVFARKDVVLKARPYLREVNNIMDEILLKMLKGEVSAEEAVDQATWRLIEVLENSPQS